MIAVLNFPQIDPIAVSFGPFAIRWYSLAYITGLLLGWRYCLGLVSLPPRRISRQAIDDFLLWATLGVVFGGRLGYVLFYKPGYFLSNPQEILFLWQGGMSFHGGLLGVIVAMVLFARRIGVPFLALSDVAACAAPIGLFLGRIANFVNGELFGRPSDVPWAMVFPHGGPLARHPSQIYEALLEGLILFLVVYLLVRRGALRRTGLISGVFLSGYALSRMLVELFREPDAHLGTVIGGITMGQALSLPMLLIGLGAIAWSRRART